MKKITFLFIFIFMFYFSYVTFAEEGNVQIQKGQERTEALVTPVKIKDKKDQGIIDRSFGVMEDGVMGAVAPISYWTGKGVDAFVYGVQETGSFILRPFFHFIDLKNKLS